jgi:hypothetical protein
MANVENVQVTVTAGYPVKIDGAVVIFERCIRHSNTFSIILRVLREEVSSTQELYKGDEIDKINNGDGGRWILSGLRDESGNGVHPFSGNEPVTALLRLVKNEDYNVEY